MTAEWIDLALAIAAHHLWQSVALLALAGVAIKLASPDAEARSWLWLCLLVLVAVSPLAVLLPASDAASNAVMVTAPASTNVDVDATGTTRVATAGPIADDADAIASSLKPALLLLWALGFVWSLCGLASGWLAARRLRDTAHDAPYLERLLRTELPARASIKLSDRIAAPTVVGLAHPCILVPTQLLEGLDEVALRHILRHEIGHIQRHDLWVSLAQRLLTAFYWWSPALRFVGARLNLAREMACDERAAGYAGSGRAYADSLLTGIQRLQPIPAPRQLLAVGMFDQHSHLSRRIDGLLDMDASTRRRGFKFALVLCTAVLATGAALTLAATPRKGAAASSPSAMQLIAAAGDGRVHEVQRLVADGADVDAPVAGDGSALIVASKAGDARMALTLLRMGANPNLAVHGDGNPLIAAAMTGHRNVVALLVDAGADVNGIVPDDETPLINAARYGHLPVVEYLVEHGADVNLGVRADFGRWRSPLNQASDERIRDYLIRHGAVAGGP